MAGHVPAFGPVAPARRSRAPGHVEFFPVRAQMGQMRAVGVGRDGEPHERIVLGADFLRHLLEFDPVETKPRIVSNLPLHRPPCGHELVRLNSLREVGGEQRPVVVAQILPEPAQPAHAPFRHDAQRRDEGDPAVAEAGDDDCGARALARPDVTIPKREPVERLERGAVGNLLEAPPFAFDRGGVAENLQRERRPPGGGNPGVRRDRAVSGADRRSRVFERRHWGQTRHCIDRDG